MSAAVCTYMSVLTCNLLLELLLHGLPVYHMPCAQLLRSYKQADFPCSYALCRFGRTQSRQPRSVPGMAHRS